MIIFYSWQSDLPNNTNRGFIGNALVNVAKTIRKDNSLNVEPVIDRDIQGTAGTVNIAETILKKIEDSQIFVCDVSIINQDSELRKTPNPNVLYELGFATKTLGESQIILVMNTKYGRPEDLPFDLRMKTVVTYSISIEAENKTTERKILESKLESAIRAIIKQMPVEEVESEIIEPVELSLTEKINFKQFQENWLSSPESVGKIEKEATILVEKVYEVFKDTDKEIQKNQRDISFRVHNLKINIVLSIQNVVFGSADIPKNCQLIIQIDGRTNSGDRGLKHENFKPDISINKEVGWSRSNTFFSSNDILEKLQNYLSKTLDGEFVPF